MSVDKLLVLADNGEYGGMAEDHRARHEAYCLRHGMDFEICRPPGSFALSPVYWKFDAIIEAMEGGCEHITLMDADSIIRDAAIDLRTALPDDSWLGMCIHPYGRAETIWHWNAGVLYTRRCPKALEFFRRCRSLIGSEWNPEAQGEQGIINNLLMYERHWQVNTVSLTHHWNANIGTHPNDDVIVMAWHGHRTPAERRAFMSVWARENPHYRR